MLTHAQTMLSALVRVDQERQAPAGRRRDAAPLPDEMPCAACGAEIRLTSLSAPSTAVGRALLALGAAHAARIEAAFARVVSHLEACPGAPVARAAVTLATALRACCRTLDGWHHHRHCPAAAAGRPV
jgi:hypothetical protein